MSAIREQLVKIVKDVCHPEPVDLSDHSRSLFDCGLDSVDFASVLIALEDHFKLALAEGDLARLRSIDEMTAYIKERQTAGA